MRLSLHTTFYPSPSDRPCTDCPLSASATSATTTPTASPTAPSTPSPASSPLRRLHREGQSHSQSHSPFRLSRVLRRPSLVLLRRRPSKVDMALSEERTRCDEDAIERQGLDLMEPRPVDPIVPIPIESVFSAAVAGDRCSAQSAHSQLSTASRVSQPRFVMGGIFEVMEGRA